MSWITYPIDWTASQLPFPPEQIDQAKLGVLFFLAYPLGIIFSQLQGAKTRYIYGLFFGLYFQWAVFRENILHTLITSAVTYSLVLIYGRNAVKAVCIFAAIYSSGYHVYRMTSNPGVWRINISFALMIDVCKFTAFAWAYRDGAKSKDQLTGDQEYRKIEKLPSVLEYFSYIFFYPSCICGPFFDFKDYQNLVTRQGPYKYVPLKQSCLWGLQSMAFGLLAALGDMLFRKNWNAAHTITDEFAQESFLWRTFYVLIAGDVMRLKYYSGFYMSQSGVDTSGLSYTGYIDNKHVFDRVMTTHRFTEATTSARTALERWNASTQVWLKRYVYTRVLEYQEEKKVRQNPLVASWITFGVAAAWHGYYPSYFVTFFGIWTAVEAAKSMYKARAKARWIPKPIAFVLKYLFTAISISFLTIGHVNLDLDKCLKSYRALYCFPVLLNLFVIIFLSVSGWAKASKKSHIEDSTEISNRAEVMNEESTENELKRLYSNSAKESGFKKVDTTKDQAKKNGSEKKSKDKVKAQ